MLADRATPLPRIAEENGQSRRSFCPPSLEAGFFQSCPRHSHPPRDPPEAPQNSEGSAWRHSEAASSPLCRHCPLDAGLHPLPVSIGDRRCQSAYDARQNGAERICKHVRKPCSRARLWQRDLLTTVPTFSSDGRIID